MKNLFKSTLIIAGILLMSNSSCSKNSIDGIRTSEFDIPFELNLEERIILPKNNKALLIRLVGINDSRCPADVQCIWAGNAIVSLNNNTYSVILQEVKPYPRKGIKSEKKKAILRVKKG